MPTAKRGKGVLHHNENIQQGRSTLNLVQVVALIKLGNDREQLDEFFKWPSKHGGGVRNFVRKNSPPIGLFGLAYGLIANGVQIAGSQIHDKLLNERFLSEEWQLDQMMLNYDTSC